MKTLKTVITTFIVFGALLCMSCKKENNIEPSGQSTSPNLSTKGGLAFNVKNSAGSGVPNAKIDLAVSQQDLNSGTYLATKTTDANGKADFGKLNGGNYYYKVAVTVGTTPYHGEGVVQVQNGQDIEQTVTLQ